MMKKRIFIFVCFYFGVIMGCSPSYFDASEPVEVGIIESGVFFEAHVPRQVKIENIWQGYVEGDLTRIYAGKLIPDYRMSTSVEKDETQFGALYVMIFLSNGRVETNLYITEDETGALRIQQASDEYLIVYSKGTEELSSQVYHYDLQAHRLVNSHVTQND